MTREILRSPTPLLLTRLYHIIIIITIVIVITVSARVVVYALYSAVTYYKSKGVKVACIIAHNVYPAFGVIVYAFGVFVIAFAVGASSAQRQI